MNGLTEQFVVVVDADAEAVAVLELDGELPVRDARGQLPGAVLEVGELADVRELSNPLVLLGPRAEAQLRVVLAHVRPAQEPDFGMLQAALLWHALHRKGKRRHSPAPRCACRFRRAIRQSRLDVDQRTRASSDV